MNRKWAALGGTLVVAVLTAGFSFAGDDEDSPLHKLMEKVNANHTTILKGVRNAASYAKSQENVSKAAAELVKLAKEAKGLGEAPAKAQNKPIADWIKLADATVAEATKFSTLASKKETSQSQAKDAYKAVSKSCTACHTEFRVDE